MGPSSCRKTGSGLPLILHDGEVYNYFIIYYNVIIIEIKCTINVIHLNHPKTIPAPRPWKNRLPWNRSLVPKRLETAGITGIDIPSTRRESCPTPPRPGSAHNYKYSMFDLGHKMNGHFNISRKNWEILHKILVFWLFLKNWKIWHLKIPTPLIDTLSRSWLSIKWGICPSFNLKHLPAGVGFHESLLRQLCTRCPKLIVEWTTQTAKQTHLLLSQGSMFTSSTYPVM